MYILQRLFHVTFRKYIAKKKKELINLYRTKYFKSLKENYPNIYSNHSRIEL